MRVGRSLRFRLVVSFTLSGLFLGLVFAFIIFGVTHDLEDEMLFNQLGIEAEAFESEYQINPSASLPRTAILNSYATLADVPEPELRAEMDRSPGRYELIAQGQLLLVRLIPGTTERYFLLIGDEDERIEPLESKHLELILFAVVLLMGFLGGWIGRMIAHRVIAPVVHLAEVVSNTDPARLPKRLPGKFYNDEVGLLAGALERAWLRSAEFMEREQAFTRNASHELRTPVTVAKGAAELIQRLAAKGKPIVQPLNRLRRSILDMENLITTFLFLGREKPDTLPIDTCDMGAIMSDVVQQNRYLLEGKPVEIIQQGKPFSIKASEVVVSVLLGNLIRNACQYTDQGTVTLCLNAPCVVVRDTGRGMAIHDCDSAMERGHRGVHSKGAGLGLAICQDFCDSLGWELTLESKMGEGTVATLVFPKTALVASSEITAN